MAIRRAQPHVDIDTILVDNGSTDDTGKIAEQYTADVGADLRVIRHEALGAARARNAGVEHSRGSLLLFVDADTLVPPTVIDRTIELAMAGYDAAMFGIAPIIPTLRGRVWWAFWNAVRHLPLARAKALPALMFCTRDAFDTLGPFDETVAIGEEWPILAGQYRRDRRKLAYDCKTVGRTSGRRMELVRFGYTRLFVKYVMAILFRPFRIEYADDLREPRAANP